VLCHAAILSLYTSIGVMSSGKEECGRSQLYFLVQSPISCLATSPVSNSFR